MSVHPNKVVCGALLFVVLIGFFLFPPTPLQVPAYADVPLKEMESLGSRIRYRTVSWQHSRSTGKTTYNISVINLSHDPIYPPIRIVVDSISLAGVTLDAPDGTMDGHPYIEIEESDIPDGVLDPGEELSSLSLVFDNQAGVKFTYTVSYYGLMELKETTFAALGTTPRMLLTENLSIRIISVRLNRTRGGVEYRVALRNIGNENIYGPVRLGVDGITNAAVELADYYGQMDDLPYVIVEDEIPGGVLAPGEESDPIWLYFSDPPRAKFAFSSKPHAFKAYYYDATDQLNVLLEDLGVQTGVNQFSVNVTNQALSALQGPVRMKITGMTVAGVPFTGDMASVVQSKSGVVGGVPYQIIVPEQNQIAAGQSTAVTLAVANTTGDALAFTLEFESLYESMPVLANAAVTLGSPVNNATAGTTTYNATITNNSSHAIVSPMMLVVDSVDDGVELQNLSGYINGKPFVEVDVPATKLFSQESQAVQLVFSNPDQISITPVMAVQGVETDVIADSDAPQSSYVYAYHDQWVNLNEVAVQLTATDNISGVKAIYYQLNGGAQQEYTGLLTFSISDVPRTITFWAEDNAGNEETPHNQVIVKLDKDAPHSSSTFTADGQWLRQNAVVAISADDLYMGNQLSGVLNIKYKVGESGLTQTVAGTSVNVSVTEEGQYPVYFWAEDNAGNIEQQKTVMVWIDKTPPTTNFSYPEDGQWVNQPVSISLVGSDSGSGNVVVHYTIDGTQYTGNTVQISEPGTHDVTCWSIDAAGNVETTVHSITVKLDTEAPNVSHNFSHIGEWLGADSMVTLSADDVYQGTELTGVQSISYKIGDAGAVETVAGASVDVPLNIEGQTPVYFWAVDMMGNESAHESFEVWIDKTPPTTTYSYPSDGQWTSQPANIALNASDTASGVAHTYYTINGTQYTGNLIQIAQAGEYDVTCWSVDNAGNTETPPHQISIKIDDQVLGVTHDYQHSGQWITTDTLVTLTASSGNVGVKDIQYKIGENGTIETVVGDVAQINITDEGQYTVYFWAHDNEDTASTENSFTVWMDKTAPGISYTYASAGQWVNQVVNIPLVGNDDLGNQQSSGVAAIYYTINGTQYTGSSIQITESGEYDITCWSVDGAGNSCAPGESFEVKLDTQAPNVIHDFTSTGQWVVGGTVITVTADDLDQSVELSGVQAIYYQIGDAGSLESVASTTAEIVLEDAGSYSVYFWATDQAGNESAHQSVDVMVDAVDPVTTAVYDYDGIWVTTGVSIPLNATDADSGVAQIRYSINGVEYTGNLIQITQSGTYYVNYWSIDNAGNKEPRYTNQYTVMIDRAAPTTTTNVGNINNVWVNYPVDITLTQVDPEGNEGQTYYRINGGSAATGNQISLPDDGIHQIEYWSVDSLNNTEASKTLTIKIDTKKPETTDNYDGTIIGEVTITLTPSDENGAIQVSGLKTTKYSINGGSSVLGTTIFLPGTGTYNIEYWSEDKAGNIEDRNTLNIAFITAPTLFITSPDNGYTTTESTIDILGIIDNDSPTTITCSGVVATITGTQFEIIDVPLQEGELYYSIEAENVAGLKDTRYVLVNKDTTAPVVTITDPVDGDAVALSTITITGSVEETDATFYMEKSGGTDTKLTIASDGTFTIANYALVEGENLLSFYGVDQLGNNGKTNGTQTQLTVTSDLTAPAMTLQVALYDPQTNQPGTPKPVNGTDVTFYHSIGKLDIIGQVDDLTATVRVNGVDVALGSDGSFTKTGITMTLNEGSEGVVTISARDEVQNSYRVYVRIIKDSIGPEIFVTSFEDGDITNNPAPKTVSGVARGTDEVTVDGHVVAVVDERFSYSGWALVQGTNTLNISGADEVGNVTSISLDLILDSIAGDPPVISSPTVQPLYTNKDRVTIHGTADLSAVAVFTGGALDVEENVAADGSFTKNVFLNTNTTNNIQVKQRDVAGNLSDPSTLVVIHDNRRPTLQVTSPSYSITDSYQVLVSANVSDDLELTENVTIELKNNTSTISTLNAPIANGVATAMVDLGDGNYGQYTMVVTATDRAGNTRVANLSMQYIEPSDDEEGPELVVTTPQDNSYVNDSDLVIVGSCLDRSGVGVFMISVDGGAYTDMPSADYDNDGTGAFTHSISLGADGAHTIILLASDMTLAQNQSMVTLHVTLDTQPPLTAPTVSGITPGVEIDNDAFLTNNSTIRVIGSYEPGFKITAQSSIQTKTATVASTGIYEVEIKIASSTQQNIDNQIDIVGYDKAGNASTETSADLKKIITVTYDGIKPLVTDIMPIEGTTNVGLHDTITVTFSEAVQTGSLSGNQGNKIYVTDSQSDRYEGVLSIAENTDGKVVIYTLPDELDFPDSEELTITIENTIKDLAGNNLQTSYSTVFYTVDETPPSVPVVKSIVPGVVINEPSFHVVVTTDPDTDIIVYHAADDTPAATPVHSVGSEIDIEIFVTYNTVNQFVLRATDLAGNESEASSVVEVLHDDIRPVILSLTPDEATTTPIAYNTVFEVEFDEEVSEDTINAITLVNGSGPIAATLDLMPNSNSVQNALVRIVPTDLLHDGVEVTLSITEGIQDIAGNTLDLSAEPENIKTVEYKVEDNLAPDVPTIDSVSEESPTTALEVTITGTTEPGATIVVNGGGLTETLLVDSDNDTGAFEAVIPLQGNKNNVIALRSRDWADNTSDPTTISLFSDQKAPTLSSIMPSEGSVLPSSGLFTLVFSEELDQSTFDAIAIMKGTTALPSTITVNEDGNILTVLATDALDLTMPHTLVVGTGLADVAGNHFAAERVVSYDTDDPIFPSQPILSSASEESPTKASEITFEGAGENFTDTTVVQAVIPGGTVVAEVATYDTMFFTITVPLEANKINVIRIRGKRPSGNIGEAAEVLVSRDIAAPVIEVLAPEAGVTLPSDSVTLVAHITDASEITSCTVNGIEKVLNIDANGYLTTVLENLTDGMNVTIEATDEVNNKATNSFPISVNVEDPNTEMNPPIISIIFPEDGMHFDGQSIDVKGTVEDANDISMITVDGEQVTTPEVFPAASAYYLKTAALHDGVNVITVNAWDINNNMGTATVTLDVDIAPPSLVITSPEYEAIFMESNVTISGRVTDSNGISQLMMGEVSVAYDNDGYFSVDLNIEEGANTVSFEATDVAGNTTSLDWIVYYDIEGPILQAIDPVDGETGVPFSTSVRLEFDERLDPETVSNNTVKVIYLDDIGDEVKELTGNVAVDRNIVIFSPNTLLEPGITYRVKILPGIHDLVGFPLQNPTSTVFTVDTEITTVRGMVIDPDTGAGIYNATVSIVGTDISQKTDKLGAFYIERATIPAGVQILDIDGTTAIVEDTIKFGQNRCPIMVLTNESNTLNKSIYLPRVNPLSTEYINGNTEQVVTFNDTISGAIEDTVVPDRFSMTVPAGALEFPNGSTSGPLSAMTMHEMFLPNPSVDPALTVPLVTAVWFHPFGVKCSETIPVNIPFPSDRGDTGISPGDHFLVVSYNSETCEWDEVGIGTASDDGKVLEMADGYGLDELTIVAIFPIAYNVALENELNVMYKKFYGGSGEDQFLWLMMEMLVAMSIMNMMNSVSIWGWQFYTNNPGMGAAKQGYPGLMCKVSNEFRARPANAWGKVYSTQRYYLFPNLMWLMVCLSLEYYVNCTADVEWVSGREGRTGIRNLPICSYTMVHSVFSGINYRNPHPVPVDVWGYNGDIRFIGDDGQPTANPSATPSDIPWVGVYSDAQQYEGGASGLVDGDPVASCKFVFPPTNSEAGEWWKSYSGATIKSNMWAVGRRRPIYAADGSVANNTWRSYIYPEHDIRILCEVSAGDVKYVGDNYTKAPMPQVSETTGNVSNINMYCNITIGKLNVNCYISRQYTIPTRTGTQIAEQILPYQGIASTCDSKLILYTGTTLANGKTSPTGNYDLKGKVKTPSGVSDISVKPTGGSPWMSPSLPQAGTYEVTVSANGEWEDKDLMYINLQSKTSSGSSSSTTTDTAPVTRTTSGRSGGRGVYTAPTGTQTTDSRRVTPVPAQNTDRKEYTIVVVDPILYSSCGAGHCEATVSYVDFTQFHQSADPNMLTSLPTPEEQLFVGEEPKITIDHYKKVATKVVLKLNNRSQVTGGGAGKPGIVFKLTQVGAPFVLTETVPDDFLEASPSTPANRYAVHTPGVETVTYLPNVQKPSMFILDLQTTGRTMTLDIIPPPPAYTGDMTKTLRYFDYLETERESSFTTRYWLIEIIDRNTMLSTETSTVIEANDSVYNLIEKVTVYIK